MSDQEQAQITLSTAEVIPEEESWLSFAEHWLSELCQIWDSWLDFRLKLLVILLAWLFINVGLTRVAWRVYGAKVTENFGNEGR